MVSLAGLLVLPASISELLFWLATAVCAVAQIAVVRAALAGRTPGASPTVFARAREFFWVVLPAGLLVLLLAWTWRSLPGRASDGATATRHATPMAPAADFKVKT